MLNIRGVGLLARKLEVPRGRLIAVAESAPAYFEDLVLIDPAKPGKSREVVNVTGAVRTLQHRLYRRLLAPRYRPTTYSHGGIRGRHIKTNAAPHAGSTFIFTTDIADFYPSVGHRRIYELFVSGFGCSPDVARICTKLCTYRGHLALGLITSPILADRLMRGADHRIGAMCRNHDLMYTRFVDDIAISGRYPIESGSFPKIVDEILRCNGFRANPNKESYGRLSEGRCITKLCFRKGRLDVRPEFLSELNAQLDAAATLARGGDWDGTYYTPAQIFGRIQFVAWVSPGRRRGLIREFNSIPWRAVEAEARARGLVATRKLLSRKVTGQVREAPGRPSAS